MIQKLLPLLLLFSSVVFGQDNTNPYVGPGNVVNFTQDWLATPPQRGMFTQISDTPSSNPPKFVGPNDNLATVLAAAVPGDRIVVDPGNTTLVSNKLLSASGSCTTQQYITLEPSTLAYLPDEFTRITPLQATLLPKITITTQNGSVVLGSCFRWIGFEVNRTPNTSKTNPAGVVYNLINPGASTTELHDIIYDRLYVHGDPTDETNRGLMLNNTYNIAVINSYFSDFHCWAAVGKCGDSQAISGGGSSVPDGNFKIVNNYLEASGENILFGGSAGSVVLSDVWILYNDIFKKPSWNPGDPTYAPAIGYDGKPHPFITKNGLELKNCTRCVIEGNRLQNSWGGFTQVGAMILLTPKNAGSAAFPSQCPVCEVTHVTVRYNWSSNSGQAMQIAYAKNDYGYYAADAGFFAIDNNVFDGLQYQYCSQCSSFLNIIGGFGPNGALHDLMVANDNYVLATPGTWLTPATSGAGSTADGFLNLSSPMPGVTPATTNLNFDYNIVDDIGNNGLYSTGGGTNPLTGNCWSQYGFKAYDIAFPTCWVSGSMTGNQLTSILTFASGRLPWPAGNYVNQTAPNAGANISLINAALAKRH